MTTIDEFLETVHEIARREQRQPEEILAAMLHDYEAAQQASKPADVDEEIRAFRRKMYARARRYWHQVGDEQRLKLTDDALDEQFWLFDNDGIPRLKSDEGKFELKPEPLEALVGLFASGLGDLSTSVRETLEKTTHPKYGWTRRDRPETDSEAQERNPFLMIAAAADALGDQSSDGTVSARSREILENEFPEYLMNRLRNQDAEDDEEQRSSETS